MGCHIGKDKEEGKGVASMSDTTCTSDRVHGLSGYIHMLFFISSVLVLSMCYSTCVLLVGLRGVDACL